MPSTTDRPLDNSKSIEHSTPRPKVSPTRLHQARSPVINQDSLTSKPSTTLQPPLRSPSTGNGDFKTIYQTPSKEDEGSDITKFPTDTTAETTENEASSSIFGHDTDDNDVDDDSPVSSISLNNERHDRNAPSTLPLLNPPHGQPSKEAFAEMLQKLDELNSSLSSLRSDVNSELTQLRSSCIESIDYRFQVSLQDLTQIQSSMLEQSRNQDCLSRVSSLPGTPPNAFSPSNIGATKNKELTNKIDDLLARLKEATSLPSEILTARPSARPLETKRGDNNDLRGNSWEDDMEKKVLEELNFVTNAISNVERASQLEAEVKDLRARLAATSVPCPSIAMTNRITTEKEAAVLLEEARIKRKWLESMQKGSWFFRIARKFGPLGRAIKALQRRRVFIRLSPDFRFLLISTAEPKQEQDGDESVAVKPQKTTTIALDSVESFQYGHGSRAYRLLEEAKSDTEHPAYLCVSFTTSKVMIDLIALNDSDIEQWVLGLNCLIPFFPGRQFFTAAEFTQKKTALRQEFFQKMDNNGKERRQLKSSKSCEKEKGTINETG